MTIWIGDWFRLKGDDSVYRLKSMRKVNKRYYITCWQLTEGKVKTIDIKQPTDAEKITDPEDLALLILALGEGL